MNPENTVVDKKSQTVDNNSSDSEKSKVTSFIVHHLIAI